MSIHFHDFLLILFYHSNLLKMKVGRSEYGYLLFAFEVDLFCERIYTGSNVTARYCVASYN